MVFDRAFLDAPAIGLRFEVSDETGELAAALLRQVKYPFELSLAEIAGVQSHISLRSKFTGRALGPTQEIDEQRLRTAFEAFGDIG